MDVNGVNAGAATFAMKKALEMQGNLLDLVGKAALAGAQPLAAETPVASQTPDLAALSGKGRTINLVA